VFLVKLCRKFRSPSCLGVTRNRTRYNLELRKDILAVTGHLVVFLVRRLELRNVWFPEFLLLYFHRAIFLDHKYLMDFHEVLLFATKFINLKSWNLTINFRLGNIVISNIGKCNFHEQLCWSTDYRISIYVRYEKL